MINELKFNLLSIVIILLILKSVGWSKEQSSVYRQENEIKLDLPVSRYSDVWNFLKSEEFKNRIDASLESTVSEESFSDIYFDNKNLYFLKNEHGIRHRVRSFDNDPNHPDNLKQLVQVKLSSKKLNSTTRSEIKFVSSPIVRERGYLDQHPLFRLIDRGDRKKFRNFIKGLGQDALELRPLIKIQQKRKRVYLKKNGQAFATITLDLSTSQKFGLTVNFSEVELELNEVAYTLSSKSGRDAMELENNKLRMILKSQFPFLKQDQTPKFNKTINLFVSKNANFKSKLVKDF